MPQLSLYIDEKTLHKLENAAKIERLSISRYAVKKLTEVLNASWPEHYEELFGSITDETFTAPRKDSFESDTPRESM